MTKFKILTLLCSLAVLLTSCSTKGPITNLYGPALYKNDVAYLPKPLSTDSSHHANYISASVSSTSGAEPNNSNDELTRGEINFGQGFTGKNCNIAYSVFGTAGSYDNMTNLTTNDSHYFNSKFFGAVGGRFSANTYITSGRVDIRIIGFEMAYSREFGGYAAYRKSITDTANFYTNNRTELVTIGGTSEVVWHSHDPKIQFGFRVFIGYTLGDNAYRNNGATAPFTYDPFTQNNSASYIAQNSSLAYFMQIHQYFFVAEVNSTGGQLRLGLRF
jgi:hypothetical protein